MRDLRSREDRESTEARRTITSGNVSLEYLARTPTTRIRHIRLSGDDTETDLSSVLNISSPTLESGLRRATFDTTDIETDMARAQTQLNASAQIRPRTAGDIATEMRPLLMEMFAAAAIQQKQDAEQTREEQRVALDEQRTAISTIREVVTGQVAEVTGALQRIDERVATMMSRIQKVEDREMKTEVRITSVEEIQSSLANRLNEMERQIQMDRAKCDQDRARISSVEEKQEGMSSNVEQLWKRMEALERTVRNQIEDNLGEGESRTLSSRTLSSVRKLASAGAGGEDGGDDGSDDESDKDEPDIYDRRGTERKNTADDKTDKDKGHAQG